MFDSVYHITLKLLLNPVLRKKTLRFAIYTRRYTDVITQHY